MNKELWIGIPGFTFIKQCGAGASSQVWIARDTHGFLRAVRILGKKDPVHARLENKRIALYRSFSESSCHLLHFLYAGETAESYYYVSLLADNIQKNNSLAEYEADTLAARLKSHFPYSLHGTLHCIQEILCGLEVLHKNGMAHNDLKPENIIFVRNKLKLADPGLLRPAEERTSSGTEGFRPEWNATGIEADIYALGKVIYCLISKQCTPECFPELEYEKLDLKFFPLNEIALRCCEKDPACRYRNCSQIRKEILHLLQTLLPQKNPPLRKK